MQVPCRVRQECLAVRIEAEKDGIVYSSLYDDDVRVSVEGGLVTASGKLRRKTQNVVWQRTELLFYLPGFRERTCAFGRSLMTER